MVILAPRRGEVPQSYLNISGDRSQYSRLLQQMQRLRGRIALQEGVVAKSALRSCGRYVMPGDEESWHLLRVRSDGTVAACARVLVHPHDVKFSRLRLASSSVARSGVWSPHVRDAVETELHHARLSGHTTIEPGGWVVDADLRGKFEAISLVIGAFALAQILGNCVGFMTATVKHGSSTILRRLGGRNLHAAGDPIPPFFEPDWGCDMELLRFDTTSLNPRFRATLAEARWQLKTAPLFSPGAPRRPFAHVPVNYRLPLLVHDS